ncbi:MAG: DUF4249 family protein [Saprospiraceae bacterium]|nr:DUF4249 family protein [Saprospiraceae bacterium]
MKWTCVLIWLTLGTVFLGCEEVYDWPTRPQANHQLVVEAILTNEFTFQTIRLSQSYGLINEKPVAVIDALVEVRTLGNQWSFIPSEDDPGLFTSETRFAVRRNIPYFLKIEWNGVVHEANEELSFVFPLKSPTYAESGSSDSLMLLEVAPLYHPLDQAMYEVVIDWSHIQSAAPNQAKLFFYSFRTIDGSELFRDDLEKIYFPIGSTIITRKFGLNSDFAEYLRALALETHWQGGFFDEASSSLPTNISNGIGFFSLCSVLSDTLIVE